MPGSNKGSCEGDLIEDEKLLESGPITGSDEGPRESDLSEEDKRLLASTDMRDLTKLSTEGMAVLDEETDGAASAFRKHFTRTVENRPE